MTPLDPITRDRIIEHLTFDLASCILQEHETPDPKALAECALASLEALPAMLALLQNLAQQATRANRAITFAQNFYPKQTHEP